MGSVAPGRYRRQRRAAAACENASRPSELMRHDQAYKALFSHPQAVQDLLREFVAERLEGGREWVGRLDFSTLDPLPTERIDATLRGRANDLVWRVLNPILIRGIVAFFGLIISLRIRWESGLVWER